MGATEEEMVETDTAYQRGKDSLQYIEARTYGPEEVGEVQREAYMSGWTAASLFEARQVEWKSSLETEAESPLKIEDGNVIRIKGFGGEDGPTSMDCRVQVGSVDDGTWELETELVSITYGAEQFRKLIERLDQGRIAIWEGEVKSSVSSPVLGVEGQPFISIPLSLYAKTQSLAGAGRPAIGESELLDLRGAAFLGSIARDALHSLTVETLLLHANDDGWCDGCMEEGLLGARYVEFPCATVRLLAEHVPASILAKASLEAQKRGA